MGKKKKKQQTEEVVNEQTNSEINIEETPVEEASDVISFEEPVETTEEKQKKKKKKKKQKEVEVQQEEINNETPVEETPDVISFEEPVEEPTKKKKKKKKKKQEEISFEEETPIEQSITSPTETVNHAEEDLYAPLGNVTFDRNATGGEDLYAPFGDKTFNKDALLDSNTSNNSKINEDLTIAMEDVKPKDQKIEKLRSDNEYLSNVDEEVIKEHIKKKKTFDEQNDFDLEMIKNYMGKDYAVYTTDKFNLYAGLLGGIYLIHRKVYLYGILLFALAVGLITFLIPNFIFIGIVVAALIGIHVLIGKKFNKMYLNRSYNKIKAIEEKYNANQDDFVLSKGKELGGTNIVVTIIICIFISALIIGGYLIIK